MPESDQDLNDFINAAKAERKQIEAQRKDLILAADKSNRTIVNEAWEAVSRQVRSAKGRADIKTFSWGKTHNHMFTGDFREEIMRKLYLS